MSDEKLDLLLEQGKEVRRKLNELGESVAKIDERTEQHEKRMDRMDRKAGVTGSIAGGGAAAVLAALKGIIWPHG